MEATAALAPPAARLAQDGSGRIWQVDAARGLMLVLMTLTHLPTRLASPAGQPFGYVSAAEGFVLLSGFMAGMVYARRQVREGEVPMREAFLKRAVKIYLCQAALLVFLFFVVAVLGRALGQDAITNMVSYYLDHPLPAVLGSLMLIYNPPLLDILPMYILFMLASPVLLVHGLHQGWRGILALSVLLWLAAQFGLGHRLYDAVVAAGHLRAPVPFAETGSFEILAWQFLWVLGLWMGASRVTDPSVLPQRFPRPLVAVAAAVAAIGFVWRHAVGQAPFLGNDDLNMIFDKWQIGPLRLINLFALMVLAMHFAPWLARHGPRPKWLETLGAASLPVFCAHLVLALLALALFGEVKPERPWAIDIAILGASFAVMAVVAALSRQVDQRAAAAAGRIRAAVSARPAPGAPRSRPSRPRNPKR